MPTSLNLDFNNMKSHGPIPSSHPHRRAQFGNFLGLMSARPNQVSYVVRVYGGELGTPGVEVTIAAPALGAASPAIILTLAYQPGIHVPSPGEEIWYDLSRFLAKWLGGSDDGGNIYAHDPDVVHNSVLGTKKRTLRVQVTTHGFVPSNPAALR
jgi:hypothetical protein